MNKGVFMTRYIVHESGVIFDASECVLINDENLDDHDMARLSGDDYYDDGVMDAGGLDEGDVRFQRLGGRGVGGVLVEGEFGGLPEVDMGVDDGRGIKAGGGSEG